MTEPGSHHLPPTDFAKRALPVEQVNTVWQRIHAADYDPVYFNATTAGRWNAPDGSFGVLYLAVTLAGAFVETFCHATGPDLSISRSYVKTRTWATLGFARPLRLVDLSGSGLLKLGADGRLCTGSWTASRAWASAIAHHPDIVDGILYRARHDLSLLSAAVFDRPDLQHPKVIARRQFDPDHWDNFVDLLDHYEIGLRS